MRRRRRRKPSEEQQQGEPKGHTYEPEPPRDPRNYAEILGLSGNWTQEDLKTAYKRESQRTHPDKWVGKTEELCKMMEREYKMIQEAYRNLKK